MLVASRSQIECMELGGGYVEGWSTEEFSRYVRRQDPAGLLMVCRDHGGPWQHPDETACGQGEAQALSRSLISLHADIRCGLDLLHIDTSREGPTEAGFDRALPRLVTLYGECQEFAHSCGHMVGFEVGLEKQSSDVDDPAEFRTKLEQILRALATAGLPAPTFVVAQTGTRVVATSNRGALVRQVDAVTTTVGKMAQACREFGVGLKAHNADYLSAEAVTGLFRSGTDAINVAPEFGVSETRAFLALLDELKLIAERDRFLRLAHDSGAWRKWFDEDATDLEHAVVAGHYVFTTEEFLEIKQRAEENCRALHTSVDEVLAAALDRSLERYATLAWGLSPEAERWTF
jgi:hypothetical protein